ncbi:MAG: glycosyltransferase [Pseudomonadota bacterium]
MKLTYITRSAVSSPAAQARQIDAMARAFQARIGDDFQLVCGGAAVQTAYRQRLLRWQCSERIRYAEACAVAMRDSSWTVYTRDIAVAGAAVAAGKLAVYEAHKEPRGKVAEILTRRLARSERFLLVAISGALGDYYRGAYGIPSHRLLVAHDGVFPEDYVELRSRDKFALRAECGLPQERFLIVHTGSLYKGGAELFGAAAAAAGARSLLVHIGGTRRECEEWNRFYMDRGTENLRFIPHQPQDMARRYQVAADALLYVSTKSSPIYWCTSPLKLFEYMASGTPIIGSNLGSVAEVMNESNAFCFDPERPESVFEAVIACLSNRSEAQQRAERALHEANACYSWHIRVGKILDFTYALGGCVSAGY